MSIESAAAVVSALTVTLPRSSKDALSLRRLSASSSISPTRSATPGAPLPQLEPSWWPAPGGMGVEEGGAVPAVATPSGEPETSADSPSALLALLRASLPLDNGGSNMQSLGEGESSEGRQQHAEAVLLGLNGRRPRLEAGAQVVELSPASKKRGSRLSFFRGKHEAEPAVSVAAGELAAAAAAQDGSTHQGAAEVHPAAKPAKHKHGGWFGGFFSGSKAKVAELSSSGMGESSSGSSSPSRHNSASEYAAPITGGLAICEQPGMEAGGEEAEAGRPAGAEAQGSGAAVASHPVPVVESLEGGSSRAPSPAIAAIDTAAPAGEGLSAKPHHRRHRSLTQILHQGLGLKGLGRARRHSGGNAEEILAENHPSELEGENSGEGHKAASSKSSPHSDSLEPPPSSKPASTGGSPALSCFGLGVRNSTIGDEDATPAVSPAQPSPITLPPDFSNLVLIEEPAVPLNPVGIRNIGNSCFLSAALQCLRHTPGLPLVLVPDLLKEIGDAGPGAQPTQLEQELLQQQEAGAAVPAEVAAAEGRQQQEKQQGSEGQHEPVAAAAPAAVVSPSAAEAEPIAAEAAGNADGPRDPQDTGSSLPAEEVPATAGAAEGSANPAAEGPPTAEAAAAPAAPAEPSRPEQEQQGPAGDVPAAPGGAQHGAAPAAAVAAAEGKQGTTGGIDAGAGGAECEGGQQPAAAAPAKPQRPEHGELKAVVAALVKDLQTRDTSSAVNPYQLLSLLKRFPTAADYFDGGQHDCQEVLRVLMDLLHQDMNRAPKAPSSLPEDKPDPNEAEAAKADRHWARYLAHDSSPITDLFSGQLQSSVSCRGCGRRFTMYEPFWDLSLPLAKEGKNSSLSWLGVKGTPATIQDCLRVFTADETLEGEEAFHCEVCKDKTSATKHLRIHRFPDVLVLHIKRFKYKGSNTDKLTANVSFPLKELCLHQFASPESPAAPEDCCYDLFAVSNHYGTLSGGHYTAICRGPAEGPKEAWYSYNDEVVSKIPVQQAVSQHAYILFYARRKYRPRGDEPPALAAPALPPAPRHARNRSSSSSGGSPL